MYKLAEFWVDTGHQIHQQQSPYDVLFDFYVSVCYTQVCLKMAKCRIMEQCHMIAQRI